MHCCIIALTNSIDMGFKHFRLIFAIAIALFFASCSSESSNSEDNTKSCLIGFIRMEVIQRALGNFLTMGPLIAVRPFLVE